MCVTMTHLDRNVKQYKTGAGRGGGGGTRKDASMPLVLACGCRAGGPNDWICEKCGVCGVHCKCPEGGTPVHIQSRQGADAWARSLRKLRQRGGDLEL